MKPVVFRGNGCALVTPMQQDGQICFEVLEKLMAFHLEHKTAALILCGSTGEGSSLTDVEYASCVRLAKEMCAGRICIIAGVAGSSTESVIRQAQLAEKEGADALLISTPCYVRPTQAGLYGHFWAIADEISLPILLYEVPARTGASLQPETCAALAEHPRIFGLKYASRNLDSLLEIRMRCGDALSIYCGEDTLMAPMFSLGAVGVISVAANLFPDSVAALCLAAESGDLFAMQQAQMKLQPLLHALCCATNPIPIKTAMRLAGWEVGSCRPPLCQADPQQVQCLREVLNLCQKEEA